MDIKMKHNLIQTLPNPIVSGYKLTLLSSMTIVGNNLFVLKSCGATADNKLYPMVLYKIANFNKTPSVTKLVIKNSKGNVAKIARHANGITYAKKDAKSDGFFYIATMNDATHPQLLKVNLSGVIVKQINYIKNDVVTLFNSINYLGKNADGNLRFIIGIKKNGSQYIYDRAVLVAGILKYDNVTFSINIPTGYTSNDIYYKANNLYSTFFCYNEKDEIRTNKILCTNIKNVKNGAILTPETIYIDNAKTKETKYEIEGIVIYNDVIYSASNRASLDANYKEDGVFELINKV